MLECFPETRIPTDRKTSQNIDNMLLQQSLPVSNCLQTPEISSDASRTFPLT
jgi:hypothetical protein